MKILYIGDKISSVKNGCDQVNSRNIKILEKISNSNISYIKCEEKNNIYNKVTFGVTSKVLSSITNIVNNESFDYVFISQSLYGRISRHIKKTNKNIKIVTFFHNVEYDYAKAYIKTSRLKGIILFFISWIYEYLSCKYSDFIITLNNRDSNRIKELYNRNTNTILPTSFDDIFDKNELNITNKTSIDYLFVGYAFFANIHGIQWFIDNVIPYVKGNLYIIGKNMNSIKFNNLNDRIHIYGYVPDLSYYYYNARLVISPIFIGSGMKTKTAEALMFGKTIIGTKEAFEGYEKNSQSMYECNNAKDFIETINMIDNSPIKLFNNISRELFLKNHTNSIAESRLNKIIK